MNAWEDASYEFDMEETTGRDRDARMRLRSGWVSTASDEPPQEPDEDEESDIEPDLDDDAEEYEDGHGRS